MIEKPRMNTKMAEAFIMAWHGAGYELWRVLTPMVNAFGWKLDDRYGFSKGLWRGEHPSYGPSGLMCPEDRKETILFFRELADALERDEK